MPNALAYYTTKYYSRGPIDILYVRSSLKAAALYELILVLIYSLDYATKTKGHLSAKITLSRETLLIGKTQYSSPPYTN
jgi:hypothetical protein